MEDTSPAAQDRYRQLLRQRTPAERLQTVLSLNRAVRELALAGIDAAHPNATETQRQALLAERLYGKAVATRLFPGAFEDAHGR